MEWILSFFFQINPQSCYNSWVSYSILCLGRQEPGQDPQPGTCWLLLCVKPLGTLWGSGLRGCPLRQTCGGCSCPWWVRPLPVARCEGHVRRMDSSPELTKDSLELRFPQRVNYFYLFLSFLPSPCHQSPGVIFSDPVCRFCNMQMANLTSCLVLLFLMQGA